MKLSRRFFARPSEEVAPDLIGRRLFRRLRRRTYELEIVEVGAYRGTARGPGEGLLRPPGVIYIHRGQRGYRTLAVGTEKEGEPSVVTVRHALCLAGFDGPKSLIDGPGKLTNALEIGMEMDGQPINGQYLWIEGEGVDANLVRSVSSANMASNCLGYYRLEI